MRTVHLSTVGGEFEEMCQEVLWRGVAYLNAAAPPVSMWRRPQSRAGSFGRLERDEPEMERLERAIMPSDGHVPYGVFRLVKFHLAFIHQYGVDHWLEEAARNRPPADFFDWPAERVALPVPSATQGQ